LHKVFKLKDLHVTQQELETRGFAVADGQSDAVLSVWIKTNYYWRSCCHCWCSFLDI